MRGLLLFIRSQSRVYKGSQRNCFNSELDVYYPSSNCSTAPVAIPFADVHLLDQLKMNNNLHEILCTKGYVAKIQDKTDNATGIQSTKSSYKQHDHLLIVVKELSKI